MVKKKTSCYSPELRERAVRLLDEHRSDYLERVKRLDEQIVLSTIVDHPAFWRSEHARTVERPAIAIHHALLGLPSRI